MGWVAAERRVTEGSPVVIDCPACHAVGVTAIPRQFDEPLKLLHLIPLFTMTSTFVECSACRTSLTLSARDLRTLYAIPADELSRSLQPYVPGVGRFLVISALVLFWFPFLAPALALGGLWMTRKNRRWRRWAVVSVVASFLVAGAVALLLMNAK